MKVDSTKVIKVGLMAVGALAGFAVNLMDSDVLGKKGNKTETKPVSESKKEEN